MTDVLQEEEKKTAETEVGRLHLANPGIFSVPGEEVTPEVNVKSNSLRVRVS